MCGIFLYLKKTKISLELRKKISQEIMKSSHRGPDETVISSISDPNNSIILGFHRLRIMDTILGRQPMFLNHRPLIKLILSNNYFFFPI